MTRRDEVFKSAEANIDPDKAVLWRGEAIDVTWPRSALLGVIHHAMKEKERREEWDAKEREVAALFRSVFE